jgi:hypothetical protein
MNVLVDADQIPIPRRSGVDTPICCDVKRPTTRLSSARRRRVESVVVPFDTMRVTSVEGAVMEPRPRGDEVQRRASTQSRNSSAQVAVAQLSENVQGPVRAGDDRRSLRRLSAVGPIADEP